MLGLNDLVFVEGIVSKYELAPERTREVVVSLREMHSRLEKIAGELHGVYGKPTVYYARKAQDAIESLRRLLREADAGELIGTDADDNDNPYCRFET